MARAIQSVYGQGPRHVALAYTHGEPAVLPCLGEATKQRVTQTLRWWQGWAARCRYEGPHRAAVLFALVYAFAFESWGRASWWLGGGIGLVHGVAILTTVMPLLPGLHPRMASEHRGPEPTRALEPPGFMALNYGRRTPMVTLIAHVLYGMVLGGFYRPTLG